MDDSDCCSLPAKRFPFSVRPFHQLASSKLKEYIMEMEIEEVVFDSLEGCNEMFEEMTTMACCGTQGGSMCGCGPSM